MVELLFRYNDGYTPQKMEATLAAQAEIAFGDLGLSCYPNEVIVIPESGMLDAYANHGMPAMYAHWSFGKRWHEMKRALKNGDMGLAYEMVVPTNPCISWNLASNGMATMASVMAHAAFGHNHVFRNNVMFRKWTAPAGLAQYCKNARDAIRTFEERYGEEKVEELLDCAHILSVPGGYFTTSEPPMFDLAAEQKRLADAMRAIEQSINPELMASVPGLSDKIHAIREVPFKETPRLPEANILYFCERFAPNLKQWERETIRIVRTFAQQTSFPYLQTKILNEGAAEFCEWYIMYGLYRKGLIDQSTLMEAARISAGVRFQYSMRDPALQAQGILVSQINPYTLGLDICKDIVRISGMNEEDAAIFDPWIDTSGPTDEDRAWFPWAGDRAWRERLRYAWGEFTDETFIQQFLSPHVMRKWGFFVAENRGDHYRVTNTIHERTHAESGYEQVRYALAQSQSLYAKVPQVVVEDVDLEDSRTLTLRYHPRENMPLDEEEAAGALEAAERLWGHEVVLQRPMTS